MKLQYVIHKMKPQILILSRESAEDYFPLKTSAVISISDPEKPFVSYIDPTNLIKGELKLKFHDIEKEHEDLKTPQYKTITSSEAKLIADFIKEFATNIEIFVINCEAGISRSSAIAAVISEYIYKTSYWVWSSPMYHPNQTVYNLVKAELKLNQQSIKEN